MKGTERKDIESGVILSNIVKEMNANHDLLAGYYKAALEENAELRKEIALLRKKTQKLNQPKGFKMIFKDLSPNIRFQVAMAYIHGNTNKEMMQEILATLKQKESEGYAYEQAEASYYVMIYEIAIKHITKTTPLHTTIHLSVIAVDISVDSATIYVSQ